MKNGKNLNGHFPDGIVIDINNFVEDIVKEFKDNYNVPEVNLIDFLQNDATDMVRDIVLNHFADIYSFEKNSKTLTGIIKLTLTKLSVALIFGHWD